MRSMDLPPPVQYVTTADGINVAYTVSGGGPPLVFVPNLMNHVLLSWQKPNLGSWLRALAGRFRLVCYDSRGMGMSTRGLSEDHSVADYETDLEAVLGQLQLERVVLCAQGSGSQIAIRYVIGHPEQVAALVLIGPATVQSLRAGELIYRTLPEQDWEMFLNTTAKASNPSRTDIPKLVEMMKLSVTQEDWLRHRRGRRDDHEAVLSQVRTPTLVLHPRDFVGLPVEESMKVAQLSKGRLEIIDGDDNHGDARQGLTAIERFLADLPQAVTDTPNPIGTTPRLSARELDVLRLVAAGRTNQQIADDLVISLNTVRRHMTNIFAKTGTVNRVGAASFAHQHSLT
jgi:pimeloyl-ACP methyl ester carboxylesterase/DNA-binding CsgD family transcriptional regulator